MDKSDPKKPTGIQKGQRITADFLNEIIQAATGRRGTRPPSQKKPAPLSTGKLKQMVFKSAPSDPELDYFICRTWDGTTEGTEDIKVAKPVSLRYETTRTISVGDTITYVWSGGYQREATNLAGLTETQVIVPSYVVDDLILVATVDYTEVYDDSDPAEPIYYVDSNNAARAWARQVTP